MISKFIIRAILPAAELPPETRVILQILSTALFGIFVTVAIDLYPFLFIS